MVAVFGGSFDPVHKAHVAIVEQVQATLTPRQFIVVPCHIPPHKASLSASAEHRLAMLALAFNDVSGVQIDRRELTSKDVSYSVNTLDVLRREVGEHVSLVFIMGLDSWLNFSAWFKWREILRLSNLLVIHRPGQSNRPLSGVDTVLWEYQQHNEVSVPQLCQYRAGKVAFLNTLAMPVAATRIRKAIADGSAFDMWLPSEVYQHIIEHQLYEEH